MLTRSFTTSKQSSTPTAPMRVKRIFYKRSFSKVQKLTSPNLCRILQWNSKASLIFLQCSRRNSFCQQTYRKIKTNKFLLLNSLRASRPTTTSMSSSSRSYTTKMPLKAAVSLRFVARKNRKVKPRICKIVFLA